LGEGAEVLNAVIATLEEADLKPDRNRLWQGDLAQILSGQEEVRIWSSSSTGLRLPVVKVALTPINPIGTSAKEEWAFSLCEEKAPKILVSVAPKREGVAFD
jgi:hypothetical protein